MNRTKEQLWQAYIDGELSTAESAEFEASLTERERNRLAAELQFENALSDRLGRRIECPQDVWHRTRALVKNHAGDQRPNRVPRRWIWGSVGSLAAAAAIALAVTFGTPLNSIAPDAFVVTAATVEELGRESEIDRPDKGAVEAYLHAHGIQLDLADLESIALARTHSDMIWAGARTVSLRKNNGEATELLIGCCKQPVKILLVRRGSEGAKIIGEALGEPDFQVQAARNIGDYLAAAVGRHHDIEGLLEAIKESEKVEISDK